MNSKTPKGTSAPLDFIFGEPIPQPELIEQDTEKVWQAWLDAMTARDAANAKDQDDEAFARTVPMPMMH